MPFTSWKHSGRYRHSFSDIIVSIIFRAYLVSNDYKGVSFLQLLLTSQVKDTKTRGKLEAA